MDLTQSKLTKQEWMTTEVPVSEHEAHILQMIMRGYQNPDIHMNLNLSLSGFLKIPEDQRAALEPHLFDTFFRPCVEACPLPNRNVSKDKRDEKKNGHKKAPPIKKADAIRIENMRANIEKNRGLLFEFVLLGLVESIRDSLQQGSAHYAFCLYTLMQLRGASIENVNRPVLDFVQEWMVYASQKMHLMDIVFHAEEFIEKNRYLGKYGDLSLFSHQKDLFRLFRNQIRGPTLVLYIAPTGTGKTLSPLGLAQEGNVVLFVCSARHVGLGLARSAVSMQKRVAFAYGCQSAEDIRLHNFAAVDYVVSKRSGAIAKVDNTNGSRVEIMICDVRSYLIAMRYMLEFHPEEQIILYWDEPTITMDYDDHPLHETIHRNWVENRISRVVLSCATLPKEEELQTTLDHFRLQFAGGNVEPTICSIVSYDFKKSISLLQSNGKCVLPHLLFPAFRDLLECVRHVKENKTLLRYMDVGEISRFIRTVATPKQVADHFGNEMKRITMTSLKLYYLHLLEEVDEDEWPQLYTFFVESLQGKFHMAAGHSSYAAGHSSYAGGHSSYASGHSSTPLHKARSLDSMHSTHPVGLPLTRMQSVAEPLVKSVAEPLVKSVAEKGQAEPLARGQAEPFTRGQAEPFTRGQAEPFAGVRLTREDAWTLTDGPTIYIAENVENMGLFFLKQTALPKFETEEIMRKIQQNAALQRRIEALEREIEDKKGKDGAKDKRVERDHFSREVKALDGELARFQSAIETVRLRLDYVPNTTEHQKRFQKQMSNAFVPHLTEEDVVRIMTLDVDQTKKVLLLIGIGLFVLQAPTAYLELIKELAAQQKLFLILASSDYIYGTNYAFCHGFVSKDLTGMTQQKTIQAMGRIGRNAVQQDYTVRFRNDDLIRSLFLPVEGVNKEAEMMCQLFCA